MSDDAPPETPVDGNTEATPAEGDAEKNDSISENKLIVWNETEFVIGNRSYNLQLLPPRALRKYHQMILNGFPPSGQNYGPLASHLKLLRALNDLRVDSQTASDVELYRSHLVKFNTVWYKTQNKRNLTTFSSLMGSGSSDMVSENVKPYIEGKSSANENYIKLQNGSLSLVKKDDNDTEVAALKAKIAEIKEKLQKACNNNNEDQDCANAAKAVVSEDQKEAT